MKKVIVAAIISAALPSLTTAQTAAHNEHNPALKSPVVRTTAKPATGRNSFTIVQAQDRIAKAGYINLGKLAKSDDGIWRGKAMKDGRSVMVMLDFKGDVTAH